MKRKFADHNRWVTSSTTKLCDHSNHPRYVNFSVKKKNERRIQYYFLHSRIRRLLRLLDSHTGRTPCLCFHRYTFSQLDSIRTKRENYWSRKLLNVGYSLHQIVQGFMLFKGIQVYVPLIRSTELACPST